MSYDGLPQLLGPLMIVAAKSNSVLISFVLATQETLSIRQENLSKIPCIRIETPPWPVDIA